MLSGQKLLEYERVNGILLNSVKNDDNNKLLPTLKQHRKGPREYYTKWDKVREKAFKVEYFTYVEF